ncbi:hypothetical protein A3D11_00840 [Candidatus Peribacteria bacterium RIFCSPHIGHO2_02_FULL_49_16]|nr:MAG: hypothetical protein A2880_01295 [Candidatus Peribacteria bacterium RIFCSPHIGHO2_01_FULL_49_38]OGJ60073.1 MAG: hypothetical protein A3D11_00840 [Candidatus Peribacteria bacterium RIFCSPHIGHO2_02_FULL_49_16]
MRYILPIIGMVFSFLLMKYRERIGDVIGEAEWMRKIGGVYYVIVYAALLIFFWSLAELTGTTDIFLKPLMLILPIPNRQTDF